MQVKIDDRFLNAIENQSYDIEYLVNNFLSEYFNIPIEEYFDEWTDEEVEIMLKQMDDPSCLLTIEESMAMLDEVFERNTKRAV
jgi:hypothetical protein